MTPLSLSFHIAPFPLHKLEGGFPKDLFNFFQTPSKVWVNIDINLPRHAFVEANYTLHKQKLDWKMYVPRERMWRSLVQPTNPKQIHRKIVLIINLFTSSQWVIWPLNGSDNGAYGFLAGSEISSWCDFWNEKGSREKKNIVCAWGVILLYCEEDIH